MTNSIKLAALAALLSAAAPALAAPGDVLTIDLDRVLSESAAAKSGTTQLKAKYDTQLSTRRTALQTAAAAYQSQVTAARAALKPGVPAPAATQTAVQQAGEKAQAAQDSLQQLGQELQGVEGYVRQQIIEHVTTVAEQIRAERKATVVVPKGQLFASDPTADVTAVAIQRLDQSFPNPSITPPTAPAGQGR
jgi:Skp family chaperone for outer membrane proteins